MNRWRDTWSEWVLIIGMSIIVIGILGLCVYFGIEPEYVPVIDIH